MTLIGATVGNIRILEELAQGGMGSVYVGFDEKLRRRVAVKAIRRERRLDARSRERFLAEARVLSQLDHPTICRIFDYLEKGEDDYLVLELVEGTSLRPVIREGRLADAAKLKVAERVAEALAAAHEKGVIHRDLKAENVMLTSGGEVKVLDFGLAQSEARPPADASERGVLLGTVSYMSPEHARGERVTAASDMYAFGLLLQELFTGQGVHPELSEPLILARVMTGESRPISGVDPDLAALVNRLKSRAPEARPSAVEARDRLRWIRDKPRRRLRRLAAALALAAVAAGAAKYTFDLRRERAAAVEAREEAEEVVRFLVDLFEVADPAAARGRTVTAREILASGALKARRELAGQPRVRARLLFTVGAVYRKLGLYDEAAELLEESVALREGLPGAAPALAESLDELAQLYWQRGWFDRAEPLYLRALALRQEALPEGHPEVAGTLNNLANLYVDQGRHADAEELYRRSLEMRERTLGKDHPDVAGSLNNLALFYVDQGRYGEAEELYRRSLEIKKKAWGADHPSVARGLNNLAYLYLRQGRHAEAEALYRQSLAIWEQALGGEHPALAWPLHGLATLCREQGRYEEAEPLYRRALRLRQEHLSADHPELADTRRELAELLRRTGRDEEAAALESRAAGD
jgi:serine/threonine-protein kinase